MVEQTSKSIVAGQDVDSFCGKCNLELAHIVVAKTPGRAARVKCKTCGAEHGMRRAPGAKASGPAATRAPRKGRSTTPGTRIRSAFEEALNGRDASEGKAWSRTVRFATGELVAHPAFGLGVVIQVMLPNKMSVLFAEHGMKVLLHREP